MVYLNTASQNTNQNTTIVSTYLVCYICKVLILKDFFFTEKFLKTEHLKIRNYVVIK